MKLIDKYKIINKLKSILIEIEKKDVYFASGGPFESEMPAKRLFGLIYIKIFLPAQAN